MTEAAKRRTWTIRMSQFQYDCLWWAAKAEGVSMQEFMEAAARRYLATRSS